jgi:tetratricopeptide (TPR) repeat protein
MNPSASSTPAEFLPHWWPYALLALVAVLAYINVYPNTFLFDDEFLLVKNTYLHSWKHLGDIFTSTTTAGFGGKDSFYRPLQIFSYFIVTQIFGFEKYAFHGLNVLIHALNACLLFALARKLNFHRMAALLASLIWCVQPIHTEAVTYMSGTADLLAALFMFGGLLAWNDKGFRPQFNAALCLILALLSKETAVVFPALLVLVLWVQDGFTWKRAAKTWPLWVMALGYVALRATLFNFAGDFSFYKTANIYTQNFDYRIYSFLATLPDYLRILVLPFDLHMDRASNVFTSLLLLKPLLGLLIIVFSAGIITLALKHPARRGTKAFAFGILWFFAAYFPCMGIFIPVNAIFLEHWMYLPAAGLFLGIGEGTARGLKNETAKAVVAVTAAVMKVCFFILTLEQNAVWRDPMTFYSHILSYEDGTARVHNNIAMAYDDMDQSALAMQHYKKAVEYEDNYAQTHYNLARLYLKLGMAQEAKAELERALAIDPDFTRATEMLKQLGY